MRIKIKIKTDKKSEQHQELEKSKTNVLFLLFGYWFATCLSICLKFDVGSFSHFVLQLYISDWNSIFVHYVRTMLVFDYIFCAKTKRKKNLFFFLLLFVCLSLFVYVFLLLLLFTKTSIDGSQVVQCLHSAFICCNQIYFSVYISTFPFLFLIFAKMQSNLVYTFLKFLYCALNMLNAYHVFRMNSS